MDRSLSNALFNLDSCGNEIVEMITFHQFLSKIASFVVALKRGLRTHVHFTAAVEVEIEIQ